MSTGKRIAWMTPWGRESAVGRYSHAAVSALSDSFIIDVWHPITDCPLDAPGTRSFPFSSPLEFSSLVHEYDHVIYNMGNNVDYHAAVFSCYLRHPGVVILHDKVMQGFFVCYAVDFMHDPAYYLALMHYTYRAAGLGLAARVLIGGWSRSLEAHTAREYPLFEPCLWNARAVVAHSRETAELVCQRYGSLLPTISLDLPYFSYDLEYGGQPLHSRETLRLPRDRTTLLASGRITPSKRLDVVLRVLAADPELARSVLFIVTGSGDPDYLNALERLTSELGLVASVRFVIGPDDRTLHSYIAAADICVNLRNPSTESASAALVEQFYFGKPVVVTRTGVYAELPDHVAVKTDPDNELRSVAGALQLLVNDREYRDRVSSAALAHGRTTHDPGRYAARFGSFLDEVSQGVERVAFVDESAGSLAGVSPGRLREQAASIAERLSSSCVGLSLPQCHSSPSDGPH